MRRQDHERSWNGGEVREDRPVVQPDQFAALHPPQWLGQLRKPKAGLCGKPHTFAVHWTLHVLQVRVHRKCDIRRQGPRCGRPCQE